MKKDAFVKFCEQINFVIDKNIEDSLIQEVIFLEDVNDPQTKFGVSFFSLLKYEQLKEFFLKSINFFKPSRVDFDISFINKNYSKERLFELFKFGFEFILNKNINDYFNSDDLIFDLNSKKLLIEIKSYLNYSKYMNEIDIKAIQKFFKIEDLLVDVVNNFEKTFEEMTKKQIQTDELEYLKLSQQRAKSNKKEQNPTTFNNYNRNKKYFNVAIKDFYLTEEAFIFVEGEVFQIEQICTKNNLKINFIYLHDNFEAIVAKYFVREGEEDKYSWIKKGMFVSIYGEKKQEYNKSSYFLSINSMSQVDKELKVDNANKKRIEFSTRTNMSAMDGFYSSIDLMKYAKQLGHEAIAFCDYQNIQAFPEIFNNYKKIGIKPIYGSTFTIIQRDDKIIMNNVKNKEIKDERYVIFDLETTSLNPRYGEIIEFGAVIVENRKIIDTIQFFIKPTKPISKFTSELTSITQEMLDQKSLFDNQKDAIIKILDIFKDSTLVAHNASFDIGFINEKMDQYNLGNLENQIIDTLSLAKFLFPISSSYRLEIVSKKLNVVYDASIAHRADYDAKVLYQVWTNMIEELTKKNILTFKDIKNIKDDNLQNKKRGFDISIFAKNQKGLKQLFKLVSLSLTDNYYQEPKLFEDQIKGFDDLLIGPNSINSKLIDLMQIGTSKDLDEEIEKWDFIGVPSPHLFSHLINRGNFTKEELEIMLKDLILRAKKLNKIIIAIGDVRYINENDALAHAIYINTKGIEGKRHLLYKYNEIEPKYPIQRYLTTDEMKQQFEFLNSSDLVEKIVVDNTHYLNSLIDNDIEVIKSKLYPPNFDNSQEKLVSLVYENAYKTYGQNLPEVVLKRIKRELEPINKYGFSVVYWISQKLVAKSLNDGYLVGSRGSVGSSIVATLAKITEVNPLEPHYICSNCQYVEFVNDAKTGSGYDLPSKNCPKCNIELLREGQTIPFETFLGFDGDKVPDIDLNFSGDYQPIIHNEVKKLFGQTHSFRAGTISTVASKTAFGYVKKYFEEIQIEKSPHFVNYLAQKIEGSKRTTGQHPGGIIIIPKEFEVEDFSPINYPANDTSSDWKTTHFDFHAIHDNVLKLDLLGHDDPTAIKLLQKLTNVKINEISFSDPKVLSLFSSTEALGIKPEDINGEETGVLGIPEFGTRFVREMLVVAKPSSFNDLINISGLSHGTDVWTGNAKELVKSGKSINEVICCRDDIMVYLMKKGIDPSSSFNIMEKVRKGKGLTKEDEELLKSKNIEKWYIDSLNKIKYMFPKAHATAYVMMAWRIAWFKIYYPLEYYATFFTVRSDVFDIENALGTKTQVESRLKELVSKKFSDSINAKEEQLITTFEIINEMLARKIKISNIDLYKSNATEWKIDYKTNSLIPPFIVLDGLGEAAARSIIEAREKRPFLSKENLLNRTQINKTTLEKMEKLNILKDLQENDQIKLF